MSTLKVEIVKIDKISPHTNADKLEIAHIKGWTCIVGKGQFKEGDKAVYFPVDSVLPFDISEKFNVTKYLSKSRIRAAKLISSILEFSKNLNIIWISMWTGRDIEINKRFSLYKKHGFRQAVVCNDYYENGVATRLFVKRIKLKCT